MPELPRGLTLLSAMITPAVLISACGTLIFSTSTRLSRIVDRVRSLSNAEMEFVLRLKRLYQERPPEGNARPRPVSGPEGKAGKNYGPG